MNSLSRDVEAIQRVDAVPRILDVVCRTTGLGFAAVARVTDDRWVACSVRDDIGFGLRPGGELPVETTICHEIRQHRHCVVIDDVDVDPVFCGHPTALRYGFRSYISVPVLLPDGTFFGTLCAIDPKPTRLNTQEVVGMFALFAELIAFHLDAQRRVVELEQRVADRTMTLHQMNRELQQQIAASEEDRQALRSLTQQIESVREDERTRIARELHDELGQSLTALKLEAASAGRSLGSLPEQQQARDGLNAIGALTDTTLDAVERIISELRPAVLDGFGLGAAAEWLAGEFSRRTSIRTTCTVCEDSGIPPAVGTALFRVLQEALTNVARHAGASEVHIVLSADAVSMVLTVNDNGRGCSESAMANPAAFGLRGMRERLRALQGSLTIGRGAGGGTELVARCATQGVA